MGKHNRGSYIEGVGDELIYSLTCLLAVLVPTILLAMKWIRGRTEDQIIHPESEANVQNTRTHLQEQNRLPPPREPTAPPHPENRQRQEGEVTCPVCIGNAQFAVETNCGHIFCGNCMITYWRHGRWLGAIRCPVCRQTVTIMLFSFSEEEQNNRTTERDQVMDEINSYNRRFSGEPRSLVEIIRDMPTLLRHCITELFSVGGLVWMFRMRVIICFLCALLYFISPLDIIPEAAFGLLGFIDDFFILLLLAIYVSIIYRRVVANQGE